MRRGGLIRRVSRWMSRRSGRRGRRAFPRRCWRRGSGPASRPLGVPAPGTDRPRSRSGFGSGDDLDELEPGPALAGLTDTATRPDRIADLDDDELIGALRAWRRLESWAAAGTLAMVAELARRRPADRTAPATPGQFPDQPSEFLADEIAAALTLTGPAADTCLDLAMDLAIRLPGTAAALRAGIIDYLKARIIAEATRILSPDDARRAEDMILAQAGQQTSPASCGRRWPGRSWPSTPKPRSGAGSKRKKTRGSGAGAKTPAPPPWPATGCRPPTCWKPTSTSPNGPFTCATPGCPAPWTNSAPAPTLTPSSAATPLTRPAPRRTRAAGESSPPASTPPYRRIGRARADHQPPPSGPSRPRPSGRPASAARPVH